MMKRSVNCSRGTARVCLFQTTALVALAVASPLWAKDVCDEAIVPQPKGCARANADVVVRMPSGENTEYVRQAPGDGFDSTGFSISLDDETIAGAPAPQDERRPADIEAATTDVDVRYDGLDLRRMLNVATDDLRSSFRAGDTITFRASTNYPGFVSHAEVQIYDRDSRGRRVIATLPVRPNGTVDWTMPEAGVGRMSYVLRVYDAKGRYDETVPLDLTRSERALETHETTGGPVVAAGEGEDRTRLRNIPVRGGRVTVHGTDVPAGASVRVMGEEVPVDSSGAFVTSRIVPPGDHAVAVDVNGRRIVRDVEVPRSEWFHVGIADLTFGKRFDDDLIEADPDYEDTYGHGRLAFYLKGKTHRGYTITSSLDTGNGDIDEMFERLDEKDPRKVIQRLDPEDMYPTYGDDSSAFDDTPTSGRFYLKVERDGSSFTWGDFKARVTGAELLENTRALYGAELRYVTPSVTEKGDPRASITVYGAQPETLPQRDILRGTGGSVYFLTRQDINGGSETISVRVTDPDTGRVVQTRTLAEGVDYEIDYIQGVVILTQPLSSSTTGGGVISRPSGDYDVNLVAQYEYTPTAGGVDGDSLGGRAEAWVTDKLRFGVTAMKETTGLADQHMSGADLRYELGTLSYIEAEYARTKGPGFGRAFSTDGGLTISSIGATVNGRAEALRFDSHFDLEELGTGMPGFVSLWYERKDKGFSTLVEDIAEDQTLFGIEAEVEVSDRLRFGMEYEEFEREGGDSLKEGEVRLAYRIDDAWTVAVGLGHEDRLEIGDPDETGTRSDIGLRLTYEGFDDLTLYSFGQVTVDRSGGLERNDRLGAGFEAQVSEKLALAGEISDGSQGMGGKVRANYSPTPDNELYLGYTLDPTRTGAGYDLVGRDDGKVVLGGKFRRSEKLSTFAEHNWDLFGERRSLTKAYGVTYTPSASWTLSGGYETGEVRDSINGDFDRTAVSAGMAYVEEDAFELRGRLEYRTESGKGVSQDRETWAFSGGYEYKVNDDWRFLANMDALYSDSAESSFRDGEYLEASLGYAYRPVMNDRLNMLFKYSYLHDLPGEDQVTANGSTDGPMQKSHVLSIDANYDLTPKLTIGGKYGYRQSRVADRGTDVFTASTAHLGILRMDWHVVHKWDVLIEGRVLYSEEIETTETGALAGIYRHVGNNAKIGVGYEWGRVSDDMTNLDYYGSGAFVNLVAKF